MERPQPLAQAGWLADPSQPRQWRYWDGARWTEHTYPLSGAQVPPAPVDLTGDPTSAAVEAPKPPPTGRSRTQIALLSVGALCLIAIAVGGAVSAIRKSQADNEFVAQMQADTSWSGFEDEEARLLIKFGRGVCEGFDNGMNGIEVYGTLVNAIGDTNDPNGIPAPQISSLMDHAISAYCPGRAPLWTDHSG